VWAPKKSPVDSKSTDILDPKSPFAARFPHVFGFLVCRSYDDGTPRETGSLTLFLHDGLLKGMLKDREAGKVGFKACDSLEGVLKALDDGLADDGIDWRPDRSANPKKR